MTKPSTSASFISSDWEGRNVGRFQMKADDNNTIEFVCNWTHLKDNATDNNKVTSDFIYLGDTAKRLLPITSFDLLDTVNPEAQVFGNRDLNVLFAAATIENEESIRNYVERAFDDINNLLTSDEDEITYAALKKRYHQQRVEKNLTYVDPGKALLVSYVLENYNNNDQHTISKAEIEKAKARFLQMSLPQQRVLLLRYLHNETFGYPNGFEAHCFNLWLNAITDFLSDSDKWQTDSAQSRVELLNDLHESVRKAKTAKQAQQTIIECIDEWIGSRDDISKTDQQQPLKALCELSINDYTPAAIQFFHEFNNLRINNDGVLMRSGHSKRFQQIQAARLLQQKNVISDNDRDTVMVIARHYPGLACKDDDGITGLREAVAVLGADDNDTFMNLSVANLYDEPGKLQLTMLKSIMRLGQPGWAESVTTESWQAVMYPDAIEPAAAPIEDDIPTLTVYGHQPAPFPVLSLDGSDNDNLVAIADDSFANNDPAILRNAIAIEDKQIFLAAPKDVIIDHQERDLEAQVFDCDRRQFISGLPAVTIPYSKLKQSHDTLDSLHGTFLISDNNQLDPILMGCFQDKADKGNMKLYFFAQGGREMGFKKASSCLSVADLFNNINFFPQDNDTITKSTLLTQLALQANRLSIEDLVTLGKNHAYKIPVDQRDDESSTDDIQYGASCLSEAAQNALRIELLTRLNIAKRVAAKFVNKADHSNVDYLKRRTGIFNIDRHNQKYRKMHSVSQLNTENRTAYSIGQLAGYLDDFVTAANIHRRKKTDTSKRAATVTDLFAVTADQTDENMVSARSFENLYQGLRP